MYVAASELPVLAITYKPRTYQSKTVRASRYPSHFVSPSRSRTTGGQPSWPDMSYGFAEKYTYRMLTTAIAILTIAREKDATFPVNRDIERFYVIRWVSNRLFGCPQSQQGGGDGLCGSWISKRFPGYWLTCSFPDTCPVQVWT